MDDIIKDTKFEIEIINQNGKHISEVYTSTMDGYKAVIQRLISIHSEDAWNMFLNDGSFYSISGQLIKMSTFIVRMVDL